MDVFAFQASFQSHIHLNNANDFKEQDAVRDTSQCATLQILAEVVHEFVTGKLTQK